MSKRKVLVVGFGIMGCRHVQALLQDKTKYEVHILELSEDNMKMNLSRIGARIKDCTWHKDISNIPILDIAIVATSSAPRFGIIKELIGLGYRKFLIEKIVFQSEEQFNVISELVEETNSEIFCNFVNRYFEAYNLIKNQIEDSNDQKINITVHGGDFGLGCNAIHYIDIFQYISQSDNVFMDSSKIELLNSKNRRGDSYREFTGFIHLKNEKSDSILLISEPNYSGGVTINIQKGNRKYMLNESSQKVYFISDSSSIIEEFSIIPTSMLSNVIVEDIFNNSCRLTKLENTKKAHLELFKVFNEVLFKETSITQLCPIT